MWSIFAILFFSKFVVIVWWRELGTRFQYCVLAPNNIVLEVMLYQYQMLLGDFEHDLTFEDVDLFEVWQNEVDLLYWTAPPIHRFTSKSQRQIPSSLRAQHNLNY